MFGIAVDLTYTKTCNGVRASLLIKSQTHHHFIQQMQRNESHCGRKADDPSIREQGEWVLPSTGLRASTRTIWRLLDQE
jgi:hypothetical protein